MGAPAAVTSWSAAVTCTPSRAMVPNRMLSGSGSPAWADSTRMRPRLRAAARPGTSRGRRRGLAGGGVPGSGRPSTGRLWASGRAGGTGWAASEVGVGVGLVFMRRKVVRAGDGEVGLRSVPGVAVGLEVHLDVVHRCNEGIEAFVWIGQQRAAGNDHEPLSVPGAAADQAGVVGQVVLAVDAGVVPGGEAAVAPDLREVAAQAVVHGNPACAVEIVGADRE